jgi:hypothetical protein
VTSVGTGSGLTGGPITSTGTIDFATAYGDTVNPYASKTANFILAAPNGTAGVPTFRAVAAADIPTLNQNTTGTASNVTGTVALANGGTGQTTRQEALDALAGAVTAGYYLRGDGTDVVMSAIQAADIPTLNQSTTGTASNVTGTVAILNGGTGQTTRQAAMDALAGAVTSGQYLRGDGTDVVMSAIQAADIPTLTSTRIDPRVSTTTSTATLTPDIASFDQYNLTAQAAGLTIAAPTGTPVDGNKLIIRILDNGTARALTWNATYTVVGVTLPTTTVINKTTYVGCIYNANNTRWDVIAVTTQA